MVGSEPLAGRPASTEPSAATATRRAPSRSTATGRCSITLMLIELGKSGVITTPRMAGKRFRDLLDRRAVHVEGRAVSRGTLDRRAGAAGVAAGESGHA